MYIIFKFLSRSFEYWRGIRLFILILLCKGKCKGIPRIGKGVIWKYPPHKNISLGKKVFIGPYSFLDVPPQACLEIGNYSKLTLGVVIAASNSISIGGDVLIAEYTSIRDAEHSYQKNEKIKDQKLKVGKIEIGNDVWIGKSSLILRNVIIEDGCIIGANSCVKEQICTKYLIYVGCPVKPIKERKNSYV